MDERKEITGSLLKKNDVIEIDIDDIGYDGEGIAHVGGFAVFIRYALPGEKVRAKIILVKKTFAVGKLETVLRASADRVQPFCPYFGKCGGCTLQHMSYDAQRKYKQNAVRDTFFKAARLTVQPDETVASPLTQGYRNKMSLPVRGDDPFIGFFAMGSHRVVPITECPIQFHQNFAPIAALKEFMYVHRLTGYNETTHEGMVRHLSVRMLDGFTTVTVVVNGPYKQYIQPLDEILHKIYDDKYAFYVNYNTSENNVILGAKSELIGGKTAPVTVDGLSVVVHPQSFFQVNDGVRELLYSAVAAEVQAKHVVDAYSGAGVLSALLAKSAQNVTAIEIEPKAVESARDLIQRNGIHNIELVCGDCATELPRILQETTGESVIVLDPPRAGCDRRVMDAVAHSSANKVVYVSCNPATLARDVSLLCESGFALTRLTPFDMFPHSANVECLAVLKR